MNKPRRKAASGGWRLQDDRPPTFRGWISTDEGEIGRQEWRGRTEIVDVHALRRRERDRFVADLEAGRRSFEFLKQPLLPYQVEGALHLAFGERVLLADDMGL